MDRPTATEVEGIYRQLDPRIAISSFLIAGLPGEPTGRRYYDHMREYLLRNRVFIESVSAFSPVPETDSLPGALSDTQKYWSLRRTIGVAEQVNRQILKSTFEEKFMTVRVSNIMDDKYGNRLTQFNLFGYYTMAQVLLDRLMMKRYGLDQELQVGDVVNVQIGPFFPRQILETNKRQRREIGSISTCPTFFLRKIEPSDRRPSCKKYDTYEEMMADDR